ncbi:MAG TPA: 16S rRNA (uracil(1498)-N(3))-methyltransferase [Steroidobacteraceae bacterium]|nr:16S rRNA (uracil(1498)-N(3))-methyltransferase [Steroidobacteraceae bacterium]
MRLTRVHVEAPLASNASVALPSGAARHLARVLRLGVGDALRLFNGRGGEFDAIIAAVHRDQVTVQVGAHHVVENESPLNLTLLQGVARGEKMDLILQKATELGVTAIVPVLMARSTVRLDADNTPAKQQHWQAVVISACEQCGRNTVPVVATPLPLTTVLAAPAALDLLLSPEPSAAALPTLLEQAGPQLQGGPIRLLVGPEGGFDTPETAAALKAGFRACRFGPRILRTETAGLAALAALQSLLGDLR